MIVPQHYKELEQHYLQVQTLFDHLVQELVDKTGKERTLVEHALYRTATTSMNPPTNVAAIIHEFFVHLNDIQIEATQDAV